MTVMSEMNESTQARVESPSIPRNVSFAILFSETTAVRRESRDVVPHGLRYHRAIVVTLVRDGEDSWCAAGSNRLAACTNVNDRVPPLAKQCDKESRLALSSGSLCAQSTRAAPAMSVSRS